MSNIASHKLIWTWQSRKRSVRWRRNFLPSDSQVHSDRWIHRPSSGNGVYESKEYDPTINKYDCYYHVVCFDNEMPADTHNVWEYFTHGIVTVRLGSWQGRLLRLQVKSSASIRYITNTIMVQRLTLLTTVRSALLMINDSHKARWPLRAANISAVELCYVTKMISLLRNSMQCAFIVHLTLVRALTFALWRSSSSHTALWPCSAAYVKGVELP